MIRVEIGDAGPGIADDDIDRIFTPFFITKRSPSIFEDYIVHNSCCARTAQSAARTPRRNSPTSIGVPRYGDVHPRG